MAHLAAVAATRLGRLKDAKRWWDEAEADQTNPLFDVVRANREDSRQPEAEREGPWPFPLAYWIEESTVRRFLKEIDAITNRHSSPERRERALEAQAERLLAERPALEKLLRAHFSGRESHVELIFRLLTLELWARRFRMTPTAQPAAPTLWSPHPAMQAH